MSLRILFLLVVPFSLFGQEYFKISGRILDEDQNPIPYAHIWLMSNPNIGTVSNEDGFFLLKTKIKSDLMISHIGFSAIVLRYNEVNKLQHSIQLPKAVTKLNEVMVTNKESTGSEIIRKVISMLKSNHEVEPVVYSFYTRVSNYHSADSTLNMLGEYVGYIYQNNLHDSKYSIEKCRIGSFSFEGAENIETHRVISADKMKIDNMFKYKEDFLHSRKSRIYRFEVLDDRLIFNGRESILIRFETDESTYEKQGTLVIDKKDYAIARKTLTDKSNILLKQVTFVKNEGNGKWYLRSSTDRHPLYQKNSTDLRVTLYNNSPTDDLDKSKFTTWTSRDFVVDYASDFTDSYWFNLNIIPLPEWIETQLKNH